MPLAAGLLAYAITSNVALAILWFLIVWLICD
jgi:hypothetical protein